jgi:hypothetical protein
LESSGHLAVIYIKKSRNKTCSSYKNFLCLWKVIFRLIHNLLFEDFHFNYAKV